MTSKSKRKSEQLMFMEAFDGIIDCHLEQFSSGEDKAAVLESERVFYALKKRTIEWIKRMYNMNDINLKIIQALNYYLKLDNDYETGAFDAMQNSVTMREVVQLLQYDKWRNNMENGKKCTFTQGLHNRYFVKLNDWVCANAGYLYSTLDLFSDLNMQITVQMKVDLICWIVRVHKANSPTEQLLNPTAKKQNTIKRDLLQLQNTIIPTVLAKLSSKEEFDRLSNFFGARGLDVSFGPENLGNCAFDRHIAIRRQSLHNIFKEHYTTDLIQEKYFLFCNLLPPLVFETEFLVRSSGTPDADAVYSWADRMLQSWDVVNRELSNDVRCFRFDELGIKKRMSTLHLLRVVAEIQANRNLSTFTNEDEFQLEPVQREFYLSIFREVGEEKVAIFNPNCNESFIYVSKLGHVVEKERYLTSLSHERVHGVAEANAGISPSAFFNQAFSGELNTDFSVFGNKADESVSLGSFVTLRLHDSPINRLGNKANLKNGDNGLAIFIDFELMHHCRKLIWMKHTHLARKPSKSTKSENVSQKETSFFSNVLELDVVADGGIKYPRSKPEWAVLLFSALASFLRKMGEKESLKYMLLVRMNNLKVFGQSYNRCLDVLRRVFDFVSCMDNSVVNIPLYLQGFQPDAVSFQRKVYCSTCEEGEVRSVGIPVSPVEVWAFRPFPTSEELWVLFSLYYKHFFRIEYAPVFCYQYMYDIKKLRSSSIKNVKSEKLTDNDFKLPTDQSSSLKQTVETCYQEDTSEMTGVSEVESNNGTDELNSSINHSSELFSEGYDFNIENDMENFDVIGK